VHNYLSTARDRQLSIEGFKLQRRIYGAAPFREHATDELVPGSAVQTDDEILEFWRSDSMSTYHPVGTAKMGPAEDPDAVVDNELRVHGIAGLRVVDASIFPLIPSGNTHAPVVAVADRAADLLLGKRVLRPGA
jgi:choline dehydrogenase